MKVGRDAAERLAVLQRKRDDFEKALKLNRRDLKQWVRYTQLEIDAGQYAQARSIFERALAVDYTSPMLWHRYTQFEATAAVATKSSWGQAIAVLARATELLPRETSLWAKYAEYTERGLGDTEAVFEKWRSTGSPEVWSHWYKFSVKNINNSTEVLESWLRFVPQDINAWLTKYRVERDPAVYHQALESGALNTADSAKITQLLDPPEDDDVDINGSDIGLWWATLNESATEDQFEMAVSQCVPPTSQTKTFQWRMYALLWLRYAVFTEIHGQSPEQIYERALKCWDHGVFTSVTLWRNYALSLLRNNELIRCRKVFGSALGLTKLNQPAHKALLEEYINLETKLLETERCRTLYKMRCMASPQSSAAWIAWAEFEMQLQEYDRANCILRTITNNHILDDVDAVWKYWAESVSDRDLDAARDIWESAVTHSSNKGDMYVQYAMFEVGTGLGEDDESADSDAIQRARLVFRRALRDTNEEDGIRELFIQFEEAYGDEESLRELTSPPLEENPLTKLLVRAKQWSENNS